MVVVPNNVPCPVTVNVSVFVAVVTVLLFMSQTLDVINDVDVPLAIMLSGAAVLMSFVGLDVVITSTVP